MELSKADKRVARAIIEKGLQQELANGLSKFDKILMQWKTAKANDNRQAYQTLYKSVKNFDKHIASRYDGMSGNDYLFVIVGQLNEGLINESDLADLSEDAQKAINTILAIQNELK